MFLKNINCLIKLTLRRSNLIFVLLMVAGAVAVVKILEWAILEGYIDFSHIYLFIRDICAKIFRKIFGLEEEITVEVTSVTSDPFEQFTIIKTCQSFNSVTFYISLYFIFIYIFLYVVYSRIHFSIRSKIIFYFSSLFNYIKLYILSLLSKNLESIKFLWIIFFSFFSIFFFNIFGMFFYMYTNTSLPVVTTFFSFMFFFAIFFIAIRKYNFFFFSTFYSSSPVVIFFLLTIIEILSYFIRLFSLSIRIFANMMSGHVLLKIFLMILFTAIVSSNFGLLHVSVIFVILFVLSLEMLVAFLQAYVFTSLVSLYLMEAVRISAH